MVKFTLGLISEHFGWPKNSSASISALLCRRPQLETFVDYYTKKPSKTGKGGLERKTLITHVEKSVGDGPIGGLSTRTTNEVEFCTGFIKACQQQGGPWENEDDVRRMSAIAVDVLKVLDHQFSDREIKKSLLVKKLVRAAKQIDRTLDVGFDVPDKAEAQVLEEEQEINPVGSSQGSEYKGFEGLDFEDNSESDLDLDGETIWLPNDTGGLWSEETGDIPGPEDVAAL